MMNFGDAQEDNSQDPKKVFLGKRSFKIVAVNPDEAWMKANKIYVSDTEFNRHGLVQTKNKPEGTMNKFAKVDIFIKDVFDDEDSQILRVSYNIQQRYQVSNDGKKAQIINKYGNTLWVPVEEAKTLVISNPMIGTSKYVLDGIKLALVGEESLVTFIRSLRNLNNVKFETTEEDKAKLTSQFSKADLDKMFAGDFNDITKLLTFGDVTIGFLLGARTSDKNTVYQDIYRDLPLRPYMVKTDKNDYLIKKVTEDQAAGRYSNTYFDLDNLNFRPFKEVDKTLPTANEDLMNDTPLNNSGGFGTSSNPFAADSNVFEPAIELNEEEADDLPF